MYNWLVELPLLGRPIYTPSAFAKWLATKELDLLSTFWSKVQKTDTCWIWTGHLDEFGYGRPHMCGSLTRAHRLVWEMVYGPITDDGLAVRHTCDVPACVNPDHLLLGTKLDNARDRDSRGRSGTVGSKNHTAKLTEDQVREIRARWTGERGQATAMMREYGIKAPALYAIVRRTGWKHV